MTPTTPSTASSSGDRRSPDNNNNRVIRKRNRVPLSCGPCRHRKLKCNRSHPCDNCVKRGDASSCAYASPTARRRNHLQGNSIGTPDEMQDRINRLESLVLSLVTNGGQSANSGAVHAAFSARREGASTGTEPSNEADESIYSNEAEESELDRVSKSIGVIKINNDRQFYASEAHWWAILSDIAEVKRYFAEHASQFSAEVGKLHATMENDEYPGVTTLLFRGKPTVDGQELLSRFPPKPATDALILRYFNTANPSVRIFHAPTFRKEYERHWTNPQDTSITWLGMCFAMMSMALQSFQRADDVPLDYRGKTHEQAAIFSEYSAQCLVHDDFTIPRKHMLEALTLYLRTEWARKPNAETPLWMLSAIIVRLAMRTGLQRDSKPYASLTAFQGEMRRRVWAVIRSTDILLSFQCGLSSMIKPDETDTLLPSNLWDEDFDEDVKQLPPSQPASVITSMSFMIATTQITCVLGKIMDFTQSTGTLSLDEAMKLDNELRATYGDIPQYLRLHSDDASSLDPADMLMQKYSIDLHYQKCMCVLHRKFLSRARENVRFAYCRRTCIEACMEMLKHQARLYVECQPEGRLRTITWSAFTSLTTHDFLLAAMILCLDLYHTAQEEAKGQTSGEMYEWAIERREPMLKAIQHAAAIWETMRTHSIEALKAGTIVNVMIERLKAHQSLRQQMHSNFSFVSNANGVAPDGHVAPEHSAAMTLGMMSTGLTPDVMSMYDKQYAQGPRTGLTPLPQESQSDSPMDGTSPFANLFGTGMVGFQGMELPTGNVDWDAWDTYVQGQNIDATNATNVYDPSFLDGSLSTGQSQIDGKTQPRPNMGSWAGGQVTPTNFNTFSM